MSLSLMAVVGLGVEHLRTSHIALVGRVAHGHRGLVLVHLPDFLLVLLQTSLVSLVALQLELLFPQIFELFESVCHRALIFVSELVEGVTLSYVVCKARKVAHAAVVVDARIQIAVLVDFLLELVHNLVDDASIEFVYSFGHGRFSDGVIGLEVSPCWLRHHLLVVSGRMLHHAHAYVQVLLAIHLVWGYVALMVLSRHTLVLVVTD